MVVFLCSCKSSGRKVLFLINERCSFIVESPFPGFRRTRSPGDVAKGGSEASEEGRIRFLYSQKALLDLSQIDNIF